MSRKLASADKELGLTQQQTQEYEHLDALRKKDFTKHNNNAGNYLQGKKIGHKKQQLLGIRVLFWKLACNRAYGAKVQRRYHARLRKNALLQTVEITDTNAGIVSKLKEAMYQWRKYSKAEAA
jgi:hypothetical protein